VLVNPITLRVMQMAIVKVVCVPVVLHGSMAAPGAVRVCVTRVRLVLGHEESPFVRVGTLQTACAKVLAVRHGCSRPRK
jgi:hypothetical protein